MLEFGDRQELQGFLVHGQISTLSNYKTYDIISILIISPAKGKSVLRLRCLPPTPHLFRIFPEGKIGIPLPQHSGSKYALAICFFPGRRLGSDAISISRA